MPIPSIEREVLVKLVRDWKTPTICSVLSFEYISEVLYLKLKCELRQHAIQRSEDNANSTSTYCTWSMRQPNSRTTSVHCTAQCVTAIHEASFWKLCPCTTISGHAIQWCAAAYIYVYITDLNNFRRSSRDVNKLTDDHRSQLAPLTSSSHVSFPEQRLDLILHPTSSTLRSCRIEHSPAGRNPANELLQPKKKRSFSASWIQKGFLPVNKLVFNINVVRSSIDPSSDGIEPTKSLAIQGQDFQFHYAPKLTI